ncbi:MAG: hypothetical protein SGPRY_010962, partial [Prymnesium sp.]
MLPDWFTTWGFAQPGPPPRKTGRAPKRGGKAKGKGKAKGAAPGRGGGFAPPAHEVRGDLSCASPPPDLLTVVRTHESESTEASAEELGGLCAPANPSLLPPNLPMQLSRGAAARETIEALLPHTGALLMRGLPMRSPESFAHFWRGCLQAPPPLEEGKYLSLGGTSRRKAGGIDLATNVPPEFLLLCHNELAPLRVGTSHFSALATPTPSLTLTLTLAVQDAPVGGETIIARNRDLTKTLPAEVIRFINEHGGLEYSREFYDARQPPLQLGGSPSKATGSWQDKCGLPIDASRSDVEHFFLDMGFESSQLEWDADGGIRVSNRHPGFVKDPETGDDMVSEVQRSGWDHTYAFKLEPGDWLMLDNMRVQHGRLPFFDHEKQRRCLLT